MMDRHTKEFQDFWNHRQATFGNSPRSVLFKNLPSILNKRIHRNHSRFILANLTKSSSLLDVGCGYGRLAKEIRRACPDIRFNGIELCEGFARNFSKNFGPCFHGSMQEYETTEFFDTILFVTVLMYAKREELKQIIEKFWAKLSPGGNMIIIEPSLNLLSRLKLAFGTSINQALYFQREEISNLVQTQPQAILTAQRAFGLIPLTERPILHYGFAFRKLPSP